MPAPRRLQQAQLRLHGARERAALVAEELALQQRLGQGRAVEADVRSAAPRGRAVNGLGEQLLADAGLAGDEDVDRAGRGALGQLVYAAHRLARARDRRRGQGDGQPLVAQGLRADKIGLRRAPLHDQYRRPDLDRFADRDAHAFAGFDDAVLDARSVHTPDILEEHRIADVQAGVRARCQRIVDADRVALAASDRERAGRGQIVRRVRVPPDDQQEHAGGVGALGGLGLGGLSHSGRVCGGEGGRGKTIAQLVQNGTTRAQVVP